MKGLHCRRGERGSKARHTSLKGFYALAEQLSQPRRGPPPPAPLKRGLLGRVDEEDLERANREIHRYRRHFELSRSDHQAQTKIARSHVGREAARRASEARKREEEAELRISLLLAKEIDLQGEVQRWQDEVRARGAELERLDTRKTELEARCSELAIAAERLTARVGPDPVPRSRPRA